MGARQKTHDKKTKQEHTHDHTQLFHIIVYIPPKSPHQQQHNFETKYHNMKVVINEKTFAQRFSRIIEHYRKEKVWGGTHHIAVLLLPYCTMYANTQSCFTLFII